MTTEQIETSCMCEIEAMLEGWKQRINDLDDLFIVRVALPIYQTQYGKKAPTYKDLTRGRGKIDPYADYSEEELLWFASE